MTRIFRHPWGWATVAPLACAVHCAVTPVLVIAAPNLVPGTTVEWALLATAVVVGTLALASGVRAHQDLRPAVPVALGIGLWTASLLYFFHPVPEELTTVLATLIVAGGLFWNSRLHCAGRAVACEACQVTDALEAAVERGDVPVREAALQRSEGTASAVAPALEGGTVNAA